MKGLKEQLEAKRVRLDRLVKARSQAYCATVLSNEADVQRETEIEELEEEIASLEKELKA
jgi:hypothetical protein